MKLNALLALTFVGFASHAAPVVEPIEVAPVEVAPVQSISPGGAVKPISPVINGIGLQQINAPAAPNGNAGGMNVGQACSPDQVAQDYADASGGSASASEVRPLVGVALVTPKCGKDGSLSGLSARATSNAIKIAEDFVRIGGKASDPAARKAKFIAAIQDVYSADGQTLDAATAEDILNTVDQHCGLFAGAPMTVQ